MPVSILYRASTTSWNWKLCLHHGGEVSAYFASPPPKTDGYLRLFVFYDDWSLCLIRSGKSVSVLSWFDLSMRLSSFSMWIISQSIANLLSSSSISLSLRSYSPSSRFVLSLVPIPPFPSTLVHFFLRWEPIYFFSILFKLWGCFRLRSQYAL